MGRIKPGEHKSPKTEFNGDTAAEMGRRGAKKSNEVQAEAKTLRDCLKILLSLHGTAKEVENLDRVTGGVLAEKLKNKMMVMTAAQVQKATAGDAKAAEWISKTLGESILKLIGDPDQPLVSNKLTPAELKEMKELFDKE